MNEGQQPFEVDFPVWFLVDEGGGVIFQDPQHGPYMALFTDQDLAATYIEKVMPSHGLSPAPLKTPAALRGVLTQIKNGGCHHVAIDLSPLPRGLGGRPVEVQYILDQIDRQLPE